MGTYLLGSNTSAESLSKIFYYIVLFGLFEFGLGLKHLASFNMSDVICMFLPNL